MSNKRILHVEDDDITLMLIQDALANLAELVQTSSIEEARGLLDSEPFDLVLLDLTLSCLILPCQMALARRY